MIKKITTYQLGYKISVKVYFLGLLIYSDIIDVK